MKRINPNTGKPFKRGDTREDGMVFAAYQLKRKLPSDSQYYYENWRTREDFEQIKAKGSKQAASFIRKQKANNRNKGVKGKRLINPETGKEYKFGDPNEHRTKFFNQYNDWRVDAKGYSLMQWSGTLEQLEIIKNQRREQAKSYRPNNRISLARNAAKQRAKQSNVPFELETKYLKSIFPNDGLCPVFKIPLEFGGQGDDALPQLFHSKSSDVLTHHLLQH